MRWLAKQYQREAVQHGLDCFGKGNGCALWLDPGMGKSSITLAVFSVLKQRGHARRLLVLAPRRALLHTWPAEIAKWDQFAGLRVSLIHGNVKERFTGLRADADVYLMSYDNLQWFNRVFKPGRESFDMLVADESTKLKNPSTMRFKALAPLLSAFKFRMVLSGTPAPLHLGDLFSQVYVCDLGKTLGTKVSTFRTEYMKAKWRPGVPVPVWEPQPGAMERVINDMDGVALRLSSAAHLDMPELIRNTIWVDLPPSAMAMYRKVKRDFVASIESTGASVTAANSAAASMKLRQIASGVVYAEAGAARVEQVVHPAKVDALVDLLEEQQGQPLLVATAFRSEVAHLQFVLKGLGYGAVPALIGGVKDAYANGVINDWNEGKLPVLLAHPTTVAHGLNLQGGGHSVCWFSTTFNLEEYLQFNARVWRQGQKSPQVIIHHIAARGTIDSHVDSVLQAKNSNQESMFAALVRHAQDQEE